MAVITEAELREMWQGGRGTIPALPRNVRFTPSARDFINHWHIEISYVGQAASESTEAPDAARPAWDKPAAFPVHLAGSPPVCAICGQAVTDKPDHLAQLDAGHFAPKTAPRFRFRGKMDTLNAQFLLACAQAKPLPELADALATLAAYCREIISAEYNRRAVAPLQLAGLNEDQIRERTHWPRRTLGVDHVTPGPHDHEMALQLNLLRCQAREVELVAASVFAGSDGRPTRPDLIQALNRLSSAVYYLILLFKAGKFAWKAPGWSE